MQIQWPLLLWIFRPLRLLTLISSTLAVAYVLLHDKPLEFFLDMNSVVFVISHSFLISLLLGRVRSESFAFLYSQGFSRDLLWRHAWLATLASVLATWVPRSADFDTVTKPVPGLDAESVVPIDGLHRIAVFDEVFTVLWNAASDLPL